MVSVLFYTLSTAICCQREEQTTPNHSLAPTLHGKKKHAHRSLVQSGRLEARMECSASDSEEHSSMNRRVKAERFQAQPKIAVDGQRIG